MKETRIIMSGNHPKLVLDEIKTMTRRTYGLEEVNDEPDAWEFKRLNDGAIALFWRSNIMEEDIALCKCPYGQVGQRLWVRETWRPAWKATNYFSAGGIQYKADGEILARVEAIEKYPECQFHPKKWRPSIHMFRWASRITLEITEVRAEKLNSMTESDAYAEGVDSLVTFMLLWDRLNKKRGYEWKSNCWVWVITFKLCQ